MEKQQENLSQQQKEVWELIQELIGPAEQWPQWIKALFLGQNLTHAQRPLLCAFAIFNGLDPAVNFLDLFLQHSNDHIWISEC